MYGDDDVCIVFISDRCFPRHSANQMARRNIKGGLCSGFTSTAGMFYLNMVNQRNYIVSSVFSNDTININPSTNIFKFLMAYQELQSQPEVFSAKAGTRSEDLPTQLTIPRWPSRVCRTWPVLTSHSRIC